MIQHQVMLKNGDVLNFGFNKLTGDYMFNFGKRAK